jgi:hypothetical protein
VCLPWGCSANFLPTLNDTTRPDTFSCVRTGRDAFAGFSSLLSYFGEKPWSPYKRVTGVEPATLCLARLPAASLSPTVPV